jgi:hypothetical protein
MRSLSMDVKSSPSCRPARARASLFTDMGYKMDVYFFASARNKLQPIDGTLVHVWGCSLKREGVHGDA